MRSLAIGVDATCWANARGYGRFTREICSAMAVEGKQHRFVFFADERAERAHLVAVAAIDCGSPLEHCPVHGSMMAERAAALHPI